jgi:hypothetical protein
LRGVGLAGRGIGWGGRGVGWGGRADTLWTYSLGSAEYRHNSSRLTIAVHGTKGVGLCFLKNISQR